MILNSKPLSIVESAEYVKKGDERPINEYFKNFAKVNITKANEIRDSLSALNNPKIKESHIVKVIDIVPQSIEEVHKIFIDVSLSEEEANTILNIVKK